ncbi:immunoglobulin superfamily DCC subclass member 3-like [Cervus canadensis]|uniref:immunoglobulin superfamily DCC subclass member 3-like n=1 Tax=Cervus canadensis TaxID=1574408 RepID=UPI001C9E1DCE|nr:immunoglobulin superfamily DCC subclass member 3-like [Cervus canadensis]
MGPGLLLLLVVLLQDWGSELAFVRERPLVLPGQVEREPPVSIFWQWDRLALTNASSTTLMPNGSLHLAACPLTGASPPVPTSPTVWPRTAWCSWAQMQLAKSVKEEPGGVTCSQCMTRGGPEPSSSWEHNGMTLMGSPQLPQEPEILSGAQNPRVQCWNALPQATHSHWSGATWVAGCSISVEGIQVLGPGNLMISEVLVQHSSVYACASLSKPPGSSTIFICVAQGVPEPWLVWLKNGKGLSPGDDIRLTYNNRYPRAGDSEGRSPSGCVCFSLVQISAEDKAIYQYTAENSAGSNQASACLAVTISRAIPFPRACPRRRRRLSPPLPFECPGNHCPPVGTHQLCVAPLASGSQLVQSSKRPGAKAPFEHVFSNLEPATVYSIHVRAYSAEGASQDSASSHASSMGGTPAALGFPTKALNVTSVQASWELPLQLGSIQGFNLFHRKLPAARFEGPLLLASTVSSFLYTDLGEALSEIQLQAFSGHGDGKHSSHVVSRHMCPWPPPTALYPESEAGRSCSQDESSSPPGVVVGIHVGLAALIICLLCLLLGWRHR